MTRNLFTHTNISFEYLHESTEFLSLLIDNLDTCILILDSKMELQAFNNPLKTIFGRDCRNDLLLQKCGDVLGCANAVDEQKECGMSSFCKFCELRLNALDVFVNKSTVSRKQLTRDFLNSEGEKRKKHLRYSIASFNCEEERYVVVLIDDITELQEQIFRAVRLTELYDTSRK